MGMDTSGLKFPKPEPRVLTRKATKLTLAALERVCRKHVQRRDKGRCVVPGCKERGVLHHIVFRSQSKAKQWLTSNCCLVCNSHHRLRHAGLIAISGNADDEVIITGDVKFLRFKL